VVRTAAVLATAAVGATVAADTPDVGPTRMATCGFLTASTVDTGLLNGVVSTGAAVVDVRSEALAVVSDGRESTWWFVQRGDVSCRPGTRGRPVGAEDLSGLGVVCCPTGAGDVAGVADVKPGPESDALDTAAGSFAFGVSSAEDRGGCLLVADAGPDSVSGLPDGLAGAFVFDVPSGVASDGRLVAPGLLSGLTLAAALAADDRGPADPDDAESGLWSLSRDADDPVGDELADAEPVPEAPDGSAPAMPFPAANAAPIPTATASPPTRHPERGREVTTTEISSLRCSPSPPEQ